MKRRGVAGALLAGSLTIAAPAAAQDAPPFVGQWAVEGPGACRTGAGTDDLMLTITAKTLEYYASTCTVLSSRRLSRSGDNVHRLKLRCTGEGETTESERILAVLEKNEQRPDLLLHIDPAGWAVLGYQRCGG
ncbi:MAG: hypothetical protein Q8M26_13785 [Pseudolabrys sp.]|nr:hypothetical protein [Pseudolabrys sp.]